ncbi:MAG: SDR family NAD(P)-dependent oxidoreductase [Xenococcaceae cyanobacterium MO_207.B15]|nr:SDR family NAD(P)-dependent oxidoreductase [Xenococcaceae cyanobacterium MO_207.B15]
MKTVIITGGNSGLGYYCAQEIARSEDWYVIIACRSQDKATQAIEKLRKQTSLLWLLFWRSRDRFLSA